MVEAGIPRARDLRGFWIDPGQVGEHYLHRRPQAVQVDTIEPSTPLEWLRVVVGAQPFDERDHVGIATHPGWKAAEIAQRLDGAGVVRGTADVAVHPICV